MRFEEFAALSAGDRDRILSRLSLDELEDLFDQEPYEVASFVPKEGRRYFDTIEELYEYMLRSYFPESKPWMADEAAAHELAHARCALTVGAQAVKYLVLDEIDPGAGTRIFTQFFGPATLPNLAWAAVSAHPFTSGRSLADTANIRSYGYRSREHVAERIARWNDRHDLQIPMPETSPSPYPGKRR